jgi:hypothetical protein
MTMEISKENLSLLDNRLSDFKLELGRVKDEFTNAVDALQQAYLIETQSENERAKYSNIDTFIKSIVLKNNYLSNFREIVLNINKYLTIFDVTEQSQIKYGNDESINKFLDIFIKEYGLIKFYSQSKDQVLLDFDLIIDEENKQEVSKQTEKVKAPDSGRRKKKEENIIKIFDEEIFKDEDEDEDEEPLENKEKVSKEDEFTRDSIVENMIKISESEMIQDDFERYDEEYHIAQFSFKIFYTKKDGSRGSYVYGSRISGRKFYCDLANNNYFLATKSGKIIIADSPINIEANIQNYAARLVDTKPEGFIKFIDFGGKTKRKFKEILPDVAGDNKKNKNQSIIAYNLNYSTSFFERAEPTLYNKFDAKSRRLKREGKLDLDLFDELKAIYPEFSKISDHNMIMYIDENTSPARMIFDQAISKKFNDFVNNKLLEIYRDMQSSILTASDISDIKRVEDVRYANGKKLDDLISACKIRDYLLQDKFTKISADIIFKRDYEFDLKSLDQSKLDEILISNVLKNNTTIIGSTLLSLTQIMCFAQTGYIDSFAERMTSLKRTKQTYDRDSILKNKELINDSFNHFSTNFINQLSGKISKFFESTSSYGSYRLYCQYISSSLQLSFLYISAYNVAAKPVRLGWNYISCPTCKKDIYYSKYKVSPTGVKGDELSSIISGQLNISKEKAKAFIDPSELSDYKEIRYSFFTKNGKLITTKMLEDAARIANKDWNNILSNISSNSQSLHIQGIKDRESLLQSLGAVEIKKNRGEEVFAYKTKCPFQDGNMPESLSFGSDTSKKKYQVKDF